MTEPEVVVAVDMEEEVENDDEEAAAQLAKNCEVGSSGSVAGSGMDPGPPARPAPNSGKGNGGGCGCGDLPAAAPAADMATEAAAAWR